MGNREALIEGAKTCLREKGYTRTTARDIATAAGVSLAAIGYHFGSKDALLNEAMRQALSEWGDELSRTMSAGPTADRQRRTDAPPAPAASGSQSAQTAAYGGQTAQPADVGRTAQPAAPGSQPAQPAPSAHGSQSAQPGAGGSQTAQPAAHGRQSAQPAAGGSQTAQPAAHGRQSAQPAAGGSQTAQPAAHGSQTAQPAAGGSQTTHPAAHGGQTAQPAGVAEERFAAIWALVVDSLSNPASRALWTTQFEILSQGSQLPDLLQAVSAMQVEAREGLAELFGAADAESDEATVQQVGSFLQALLLGVVALTMFDPDRAPRGEDLSASIQLMATKLAR